MADVLFKNLDLLDPVEGRLRSGFRVLVKGKKIEEVAKGIDASSRTDVIDLGGRTLMPGLIDCHVHVAARAPLAGMPLMLPSLVAAAAGDHLRRMLLRGFTTVRDCCGADLGYKQAINQGLFLGPRLFVCGRAISQTGGHGDFRLQADLCEPCPCDFMMASMGRIADGVDAVRRAVRDEIRLGADHIKVMAGGGVGSVHDPLDRLQYSVEELEAIVDEARRSHTYVVAHAYMAAAIRRSVEAGVRTIEHGNFIDEKTAKVMAERGAYLVPTLVTYHATKRHGRKIGITETSLAKNEEVLAVGTRSLEIAKAAGVKMAYGTDIPPSFLLQHQSEEFLIRAEVLAPAEIIRSATTIGAEVVRMEGKIGIVAAGAHADLLVIDGNPLENLDLFQGDGEHMPVIMKDGIFHKNSLSAVGGRPQRHLETAGNPQAPEVSQKGARVKERTK